MKIRAWFPVVIIFISICGLALFFQACGGQEKDEVEDDVVQEEEELPQCDFEYPSEPFCTDIVERDGLMWTQCDNGDDIDHNCAVNYIADLTLGGYEDWRLPTVAELAALYNNENPQTVNCEGYMANIVTPFQITCFQIWTSQGGPGDGFFKSYSFLGSAQQTEGSSYDIEYDKSGNLRALAVRKP